ncbi:pyridoxamine 5'-phosphate oxidase family protein [Ilumatobacter coccineus]|uniref:Pyridoxamine 5'-phosphate oxidase putative domain-containing protein n=1 Tax=Ilumatobacter coccineus (strain NBRC 103263 / KCTC 29153 / YM16-304) TaxID=1313172 RepID=A0A6C7ED61_ILUCY|nr:hypothetical protein [Ilumatobacter coccineus]BAN04300.1 hypothetical protein YM304_39860 [Ilumatobacter coccineus YM16-304]
MTARWRRSAPGRYIDLEWRNGDIYLEDGPDDWPRRGHEGVGGTFSLHEIRRRGEEWFEGYDGLYDDLLDDLAPQLQAIETRHGVVVTLSNDLVPLPTPCRFAFAGSKVYVYPSTAEPIEHLTAAPDASLLITAPDAGPAGAHRFAWARIQGAASVVDDPEWELDRVAELLAEKYGDDASTVVPTIRIDIAEWTTHVPDVSP